MKFKSAVAAVVASLSLATASGSDSRGGRTCRPDAAEPAVCKADPGGAQRACSLRIHPLLRREPRKTVRRAMPRRSLGRAGSTRWSRGPTGGSTGALRFPRNDRGADEWRAGVKAGDCEDFALTKRRELIKAGLPSSALLMAVATTPSGEGHAVLVVRTDKADSFSTTAPAGISPGGRPIFRWFKIASAESPYLWREVL